MIGKKVIVDICIQNAIFDGEPDFIPTAAAIYLINHHSFGGSTKHMEEIVKSGELNNPKKYEVTLELSYKELT